MEINYNTVLSKQILIRGEDNWYKSCSFVFDKLEKEESIDKSILHELLISNLIENKLYEEQIDILNYLYNNELNSFENLIKNYYDSNIISYNNNIGLLIANFDKLILLIYNKKNNIWKKANYEDENDFNNIINKDLVKVNKLNNIIGFIGNFKNDFIIFKVKQLDKKRNKGARCDQAGKADTIKLLNSIVGENKYNTTNTKGIYQKQLCILQEFLLRIYDYNNKNNKRWFIKPSEAILLNIEKLEI